MNKPLSPDDMQSLLTHDHRYQRARAVLKDQWQLMIADEPLVYRQQIASTDLQYARTLLESGALTSQFSFGSYAGAQQLRQHYGSLLSTAAQRWLVRDYV